MPTLTPTDAAARAVLLDSVRRRKSDFRRLAAWSTLEALPALLSGLLVARAVDSFVSDDLRAGMGWLAVFLVSVLIGVVGTRQTLRLLAAVVEPFRDDLVTGVVGGAMRRSTVPGAVPHTADVARLTGQVEVVREAYAAVLLVTQQFVVVTVAALVGLLTLAPVALVFVVPPLLLAVVVFVVMLRLMADWQRASILADERLAEEATTMASGLRDIVSCGGEARVAARVGVHIDRHADATRAMGRLAAVGTLAIAVGSWLPLLLILGFGSWLVGTGASAGVIVGAATYVMQGLQPALQTLVHGLSGPGLWLMVTLRRVVEVSEDGHASGGDDSAGTTVTGDRTLRIQAASFAYSEWASPVLDQLDLAVPPGDHLAIVGPSGVGKSTLAGVMSGLLVPQSGSVRLGSVALHDLSPAALARHRVLIPQEAYVFDATVRDNMTYLSGSVPDAEIECAVARLGATGLVDRLGGYDAVLDQAALSAGERQLVTLVRAYLSPAYLVILDEATCYLDPEAEARVERAFGDRSGALVVIAHRMSSARRARRVLVLDGTTNMLGTEEELLVASPLYRDLVGHWEGGGSRAAGVGGATAPR